MNKFKISTQKSIFKPIELEIETEKGMKTYTAKMLTTEVMEKLERSVDQERESDIGWLREQLKLVFGVPISVSNKFDIRDMNSLFDWLGEQVWNKDKQVKNESRVEQTQSK